MDYITTYTGVHFSPTSPRIEHIHIEDIAHSLSLICRGNGHVKSFFSVAQHCILCAEEALAEGLPIRTALACLLHDASESYLSDVPRPFKKTLSGYYELEDRILTLVYKKFLGSPLTMLEEEEVKRIDDLVLYYDLINLLNEIPNEPAPPLAVELDYSFKSFDLVEKRYLEFFAELQNKL